MKESQGLERWEGFPQKYSFFLFKTVELLRKENARGNVSDFHLHVLQVFVEHVVQASEEVLRRLLPPPIPNEEKSFWRF